MNMNNFGGFGEASFGNCGSFGGGSFGGNNNYNFGNLMGGNFGNSMSSNGFGYPQMQMGGGWNRGQEYASVMPNPGLRNQKFPGLPVQHITLDWAQALGSSNGLKAQIVGDNQSQGNAYEPKILSITPMGCSSSNGCQQMRGNPYY